MEGGENTLRLAYSGVTPEQIDEGVTAWRTRRARSASQLICEHHHYGDKHSQFGERPPRRTDGPFPVAVVIHGGFWKAQYGRKLMHPLSATSGARLGGVEPRVPPAGRAAAAGRDARGRRGGGRTLLGEAPLDLARGDRPLGRRPARRVGGQWPRAGRRGLPGGRARPHRAWEWRLSDGVVGKLLGGGARGGARAATTPPPRPGGCRSASRLLVHGALDEDRPVRRCARSSPQRPGASSRRCSTTRPLRAPRAGLPIWEAVLEWLTATPRARARARRGGSAGAASASASRRRTRGDLPRRQLARPPPARHPRPAAPLVDEWGDRLVSGWHDWIDAPRPRRRPARRGRARRAAGRGGGRRLDHREPLQALRSGARRSRRAPSSPTATTSRPTATCSRASPRARAGAARCRPTPPEQPFDLEPHLDGAALVVLSHVGYRAGELADLRALTAAHARPARSCSGTSRTRPARCRSS